MRRTLVGPFLFHLFIVLVYRRDPIYRLANELKPRLCSVGDN
jgi:hypothetical protein